MARSRYPSLTLITPSLNQAEYLEQAITSVLEQDYPNLEYLILDGGSTDGSAEIIRRHEKQLAFWSSEADRGQADALSRGFERAGGEWLAWLNADDFYLPGALQAFADAAAAGDDDLGLMFGTGQVLNQQTGETRPFWPHPPAFNLGALLYGIDYIMQPTAFFRRKAYQQCGGLNPNLHFCMDYDLWIRLGRRYGGRPVDHPIACEREHPDRKTERGKFQRWIEIQRTVAAHTGVDLTPGLLDYLVHTLLIEIRSGRSVHIFSPGVRRALEVLIEENRAAAGLFCSRGDWFPTAAERSLPPVERFRETWEARVGFFQAVDHLHQKIAACDRERVIWLEQLRACEQDRAVRLRNVQELEGLLRHSQADRDARLRNVQELEGQLRESEADRDARLSRMQELEGQLQECEVDRAARLTLIESLGSRLRDLETERRSCLAELQKLKEELRKREDDQRLGRQRLEQMEVQLQASTAYDYRRLPGVRLFFRRTRGGGARFQGK